MNAGGQFEIHYFVVNDAKVNEPFYIIPFGDVHRFSSNCHTEKWHEFLAWAKSKKRCYFLGMGDYLELNSKSERDILSNPNLHEGTKDTIEETYLNQTKVLAKELSFMKGRIISLLEGNHFGMFQNGTTTTQKLCELLDCKYGGCNSFIRISVRLASKRNTTQALTIFAHHGMGAARLVGGSLNRVEQCMEIAEADVYLLAHDHKKSMGIRDRLVLKQSGNDVRLSHRKVLLARTGSFLKGYVPGKVSYVTDRLLNPTNLGVIKIEVTPKRGDGKGYDCDELDIHGSL